MTASWSSTGIPSPVSLDLIRSAFRLLIHDGVFILFLFLAAS
jgi:hypothetical protein